MDRSTFTALFASTILCALAPLACGGGAGEAQASPAGGMGGSSGSTPGTGGTGGTPTCRVDSLIAQPWGANDDACTVQGGLIICSSYKFRFDGTWQKETLVSDSSGNVTGSCTQGSWSQQTCGVLELDDCGHVKSQLTWAVSSAQATLNGRTYSADSGASFDDCVPAACPDAAKNTDAFVGTWSVSENNVAENCSGGLAKPVIGNFVWQRGTASDLQEQDGACTWQLDVLASTFSLPARETCSDAATGATMTYYRYDGELDSPTTATLSLNAHIAVPASASSPAGLCSLLGTLKLSKVPGP